VLFQEHLVVERPVFLRLFLNTPTLSVLSMSVVVREEMKWQKYWMSFQSLR